MKQSFTKFLFAFVLFSVLVSFGKLVAQGSESGRALVKGHVVDASTSEPLPGANVYLDGTNIGTATNLDGEYMINIPPGMYVLKIKYIGYTENELNIRVRPGQTLVQDIEMSYVAVKGEVVTVTAQAEGQLEAINQQLTAKQIKNVVSADRIQEMPDVNAAESIGRLPGISITRDGGEANKVVIRGLSPKYNAVLVNGVEVPSTDRENRSVDLSMISSTLLSSIEVTKSLTPNMDANAIGGTINLKLREAPEGLHYDIKTQGGYNGLKSEVGNYLIAGNISNRFFDSKVGVGLSFSKELVDRSSESISGSYQVVKQEAVVRTNSYTLERKDEDRKRNNVGIILDYKLDNAKYILNSFYTQTTRDYIQIYDKYNIESRYHDYGVIHNRDFKTDMLNSSFQGENSFDLFSVDYGVSYIKTQREEPNRRTWGFREENAFDNTGFDQYGAGTDGVIPYALNDVSKTYWQSAHFRQREAEESDFSTMLNFDVPYFWGDLISGNLKFGGKYKYKERVNDEHYLYGGLYDNGDSKRRNLIRYDYLEGIAVADPDHSWELLTIENIEDEDYKSSILNDEYNIHWAPNISYLNRVTDGLLRDDIPNDDSINDPYWIGPDGEYAWDYDFWERYRAGYIMTELNVGKKLMLLPGVRYEKVDSRYIAQVTQAPQIFESPNSVDTTSRRENEYWFPQAQLRFKANDWFDIRLAGTKTITRPDYRYISPYQYINSSKDALQMGNPSLDPSLATNLDAFFSFYTNTIGLFTTGVFYKEIDGLIYKYNWTTLKGEEVPLAGNNGGINVTTYLNNPHKAFIKGIELDLQTNFWYLPKPFNNIVLNINYSKIKSSTYYPYVDQEEVAISTFPFKKIINVDAKRKGRIINQPNDILNVMLGYDLKGFSGRLSCLYQGNTVRSVGTLEEQDSFTKDYLRLDLQLSQKLPVKGLQIYANLQNLTDEFDETYQYEERYFRSRAQNGFTADIGIRYRR